jgi:hypothetical protein
MGARQSAGGHSSTTTQPASSSTGLTTRPRHPAAVRRHCDVWGPRLRRAGVLKVSGYRPGRPRRATPALDRRCVLDGGQGSSTGTPETLTTLSRPRGRACPGLVKVGRCPGVSEGDRGIAIEGARDTAVPPRWHRRAFRSPPTPRVILEGRPPWPGVIHARAKTMPRGRGEPRGASRRQVVPPEADTCERKATGAPVHRLNDSGPRDLRPHHRLTPARARRCPSGVGTGRTPRRTGHGGCAGSAGRGASQHGGSEALPR